MKNKVIIFDLDGVLFDSIDIIEKSMRDQFHGMTKEMQREVLTGNVWEEMKKVTLPRKKETEEEKASRELTYSKNKLTTDMYKGAKEFLASLHARGYILVLNTSSYNRNCLPLLERMKITDLFDFLATGEISESKVEKFKITTEKYYVSANDVIFITDTLGDIREADIAGIPTVAVTWGAHDLKYFTREKHDNLIKIVDSFEELENFILSRK